MLCMLFYDLDLNFSCSLNRTFLSGYRNKPTHLVTNGLWSLSWFLVVVSQHRGTCCCHRFPVSPETCPLLTPQWEGHPGPAPPQAQGHLQEAWWAQAQVPLLARPTAWWVPARDLLDLDTPTPHKDPQDILRTTCTRCTKYEKSFYLLPYSFF